ncbi:MAG: hypothetical protein ACYDEB_02310 [Dehalococcoidia bacterium]
MAQAPNKETKLIDPGPLDFEKAEKIIRQVIDENIEWLKDMAKR